MEVVLTASAIRNGRKSRFQGDSVARGLDDFIAAHRRHLVTLLAGLLLALGVAVIAGWVLHVPAMVQVLPGLTSMVFNTAMSFALMAIALIAHSQGLRWSRLIIGLIGVGVLGLALINLVQIAFDISLGINWTELHRWQKDGNRVPGQMSTATSLCFAMAGTNLILLARAAKADGGRRRAAATALTTALFIMGSIALVGYFLRLELLYSWYAFSRMAVHTSVGMIVLSLALGQTWALHHALQPREGAVERITRVGTLSMVLVAVLAAVIGFVAVKEQGDIALAQGLVAAHSARSDLIGVILKLRSERASILTTRPSVIEQLHQLAIRPTDQALRSKVINDLSTFLPYGFSYIGLTTRDGAPLLDIGMPMAEPQLEAVLGGSNGNQASLAWNNGFVLRNKGMVRGVDGVIGWIETEQPLPVIADALRSVTDLGPSAEMELCAPSDAGLRCFPASFSQQPYTPTAEAQAGALAIEAATEGRKGTGTFRNRAGVMTMAAYGAMGSTGLVSALSIESSVFYQPVRTRLFKGSILVVLVAALGALLLRSRVRPLAQQLERSEMRHRTVLNALHEGVVLQGEHNQILACNPSAETILGMHFDELRGVTAFDPRWRAVREDGSNYPPEEFPSVYSLRTGIPQRNVIMGLDTADGRRRWVSVSTELIDIEGDHPERGIVASFVDITAQREVQQALEQSNRLREAILEAAPYSIIATDPTGLITNFNAAAERMLWYRREELIGRATPALIHEGGEVVARAAELSKKHGKIIEPGFEVFVYETRLGIIEEHEWTYVRKDGSRFPVQLAVTALRDGKGTITGFLGIAYDITERKRREEYTRHIAHHDQLTGLPNRALLYDRMSIALQRAEREHNKIGTLMIDLDHFKRVNDSLGHHVGDQLLQVVSQRILACVRGADTVARMGGDEFVVLLSDLAEATSAEQVARKIVESIAQPVSVGVLELTVTPSVGISVYPEDGDDTHLLLKNADAAMYWAKSSGRHGYQRFSREMERAASRKMAMETNLRRALRDNELIVYYQPQIAIGSGEIVGFEALLRWNDPELGIIYPDQFIAIAEETGLINPIGEWVLRTACHDARLLCERVGRPLIMAINLSARQFRDASLPLLVRTVLSETGLDPRSLELEITESMLMENQSEASARLQTLRNLGVAVAVDDFGTGFSSLSYLTQFPISTLKIDRSFISKMVDSKSDTAVIQAIVAIAKSMELKLVAEGVESLAQLQFLRDHIYVRDEDHAVIDAVHGDGFQVQGYLISAALPLGQIEREFGNIHQRSEALVHSPALTVAVE